MRLIDIEELIIKIPVCLNGSQMKHVAEGIKESLHNAPTVDAIPIAWLENQAEDTTFQHRVNGLIERWRREHE